MSAVPYQPENLGHAGLRMTAEQFHALGETDARLELVDGVVAVSPSPLPRHQKVVQELFKQIEAFAGTTGSAEVFLDTDVQFSAGVVYRPCISVYLASRFPSVPECLTTVPDLIVGVLSPGSKPIDLITKREDYERFGVGEYMAADPQNGRVQRWGRQGARLVETLVEGDRLASSALAGLWIDLGAVRRIAERFR